MVQPKTRSKIIDALMHLAAERPWERVTLEALAERAGVSLSGLRAAYDGRLDVLADFVRHLDERVLAGVDPDLAGEPPRERLFDILFSRIEALGPHRAALRNLADAAWRDPLLALELNRLTTTSMGWMLNGAGIPSAGAVGAVRAQALALVWARVLRTWLDDEDPGLARTMAELDTRLRQAERSAGRVARLGRLARVLRPSRRARPEAQPAPDPMPTRAAADLAEGHPS